MNSTRFLSSSFFAVTALAVGLCGAAPSAQGATLTHLCEFNGGLSDTLGGPSRVSGGGTVNATSYSFAASQGLSLSNALASPGDYSIALRFSFDVVNGYRKIIDFRNRTVDAGFYVINSKLTFYPVTGPDGEFPNATTRPVVLTRDAATSAITAYVNGVQQFTFIDSTGLGVFSTAGSLMQFFYDDLAVPNEASGGVVDEIRIFDGALTASEVKDAFTISPNVTTVPVPSSLLLRGTGLAGLLLQRRRVSR